MNSSLASFIFSGETLFHLQEEGISVGIDEPIKMTQPSKKIFSKPTVILSTSFSPTEKELLEKIMLSVQMPLNLTEIVFDTAFEEYDFENTGACREFISFGHFAILKNQNTPKYQVFEKNNIKTLIVDPLPTIAANLGNEKRLLWASLKTLYNL